MSEYDVAGKIAVITGAGSGIGLAFAKLLRSKGAHIVIGDLTLTVDGKKFLDESQGTDLKVVFTKCDVTKWAELDALLDFSEKEFGQVADIFVPNAGVFEPQWSSFWGDTETEDSYKSLDINVSHPIKFTRMAIHRLLSAGKKGVVLTVASIAGYSANLSLPIYHTSKWAIIGFSRCFTDLEAGSGVKVVCIAPAAILTPLWTDRPEIMAVVDTSGFCTPDQCAAGMLEAVEKHASGTVLEINGDGTRIVPLYGNVAPKGSAASSTTAEGINKGVWAVLDKERKK